MEAYIDAAQRGGVDMAQATDIALRLIEAGRPEEALAWLDKAGGSRATDEDTAIDLRLAALQALGRKDEAQAQRWSTFTRSLRVDLLREHLKRLPDFEDFEAERRAMALAARHEDPHRALAFLVDWPNLAAAAELVRARLGELDGGDYGTLNSGGGGPRGPVSASRDASLPPAGGGHPAPGGGEPISVRRRLSSRVRGPVLPPRCGRGGRVARGVHETPASRSRTQVQTLAPAW